MRTFGYEHHHVDTPWDDAPPWAIELRCMLGLILEHQELTMSAIDDLNTAVTALQDEVGTIGADMDAQFAALQAAHDANNDTAIATATTSIQASIDALKAAAGRDMPVVPAVPTV